jgi:hypothetical protein
MPWEHVHVGSSPTTLTNFACGAHEDERRPDKPKVVGSNPTARTRICRVQRGAGRHCQCSLEGSDSPTLLQLASPRDFGSGTSNPKIVGSTPTGAAKCRDRRTVFDFLNRSLRVRISLATPICASSPTAEAANLKSATVLVRIQRGAPCASIPTAEEARSNRVQ